MQFPRAHLYQLQITLPQSSQDAWPRPQILLVEDQAEHDLFLVSQWAQWLSEGTEVETLPLTQVANKREGTPDVVCSDPCHAATDGKKAGPYKEPMRQVSNRKLLLRCPQMNGQSHREEYVHRWLSLVRSICDEKGVEFAVLGQPGQATAYNRYLANPKRGCCRLPTRVLPTQQST